MRQQEFPFILDSGCIVSYFDKCVSYKAKSCLNWGDVLLSDKARHGAWQLSNKN